MAVQTYIQVWVSTETQLGKIKNIIDEAGQEISSKNEVMLAEKRLSDDTEIDFLESEAVQIYIEYSAASEELKILARDLTDPRAQRDVKLLLLNVPIKL